MKRRIVVIGGVAAGTSAAAKAKRTNPDAEVVLYEAGDHISYGVCEIPYFVSDEITDPEKLLIYTPERFLKEKNVTAFTNHYVDRIDTSKRELTVKNIGSGKIQRDHYDKLILATGCESKKLGLEGENARNVFHVKSLSAAYALKKFIRDEKPESAVIIGSGFIGLEMAEAFRNIGLDVTLISKSSLPMSSMETEIRILVKEEIESRGIRFIGNAQPEWFGVGQQNNVVAVGTKNESIAADLVVVAIGVRPNTALASASGIKIGNFGGIVTTDRMNVFGADNVFAAGDCCEIKNIITQKSMYLSLATTASKTGWVAGENAAGGTSKFSGAVKAIGLRFFDKEISQVGLNTSEAAQYGFQPVSATITASTKAGMMSGNSKITITAIADKKSGTLLGANIFGGDGSVLRGNIFAVALRQKMTVSEIAELDLIYTPPLAPLWDGVLVSGRTLKKQI